MSAAATDETLPKVRPGAPAIVLTGGQVLKGRVMGVSPVRVIVSIGERNPHFDPGRVIAMPSNARDLAMIADDSDAHELACYLERPAAAEPAKLSPPRAASLIVGLALLAWAAVFLLALVLWS